MADLPEFNAATGFDALEKTMQADKEAMAGALKRQRIAAEKRAALEEAKLAKVDGAGMSVSDFASDQSYQGFTPSNMYARAGEEMRMHAGRKQQEDLHGEANRVAADFANDQAVQRDRERESAEATAAATKELDHLKAGATALVAVFATVGQVLERMNDKQGSGAKHVGSLQESLGSSLRSLGASSSEQADIIKKATNGEMGSGASPDEIGELFAAGESAKGALPANSTTFKQTLAVVQEVASGRRDMNWGRKALSMGRGLPAVGAAVASIGTTPGGDPAASAATRTRVDQDNRTVASESSTQLRGNAVNDYRTDWENYGRESAWGSFVTTIGRPFRGLNEYSMANLAEQNAARERQMAENIKLKRQHLAELKKMNATPPSTTAGRNGP